MFLNKHKIVNAIAYDIKFNARNQNPLRWMSCLNEDPGWKTTPKRRTAGREPFVSRHPMEDTPSNPPCITHQYRIEGFKGVRVIN